MTTFRRNNRQSLSEQGWVPGRWYPGSGEPVDPDQIDLMGTGGLGAEEEDQEDKEVAESVIRSFVRSVLSEKKGLWDNIWARRRAGKRPKRPGEKGYPKTLDIEESDEDSSK